MHMQNIHFDNTEYGERQIAGQLQTAWMGRDLHFYESIDSTNARAQLMATEGASDGTLIVADKQTAGRGRRGRNWISPAGTNVYFTLLLKPAFSPQAASKLTLLMAYAVKCAVDKYVSCAIKWPNDIVVNGQKVCGILTELRLEGTAIHHVAIGVGINVGKQEFAQELADKATCLADVCPDESISRSGLIADILKVFEAEYEAFAAADEQKLKGFRDKYNACLVNKGREVCVLDPKGEYCGIARGINEDGELLVELSDGMVNAVYAGEVSVRGIYGYV